MGSLLMRKYRSRMNSPRSTSSGRDRFVAQMIREGIADGSLRAVDPPREAQSVFALVDGVLMHAAMDPAFCPADELADRAWRLVADRLLTVQRLRYHASRPFD